MLPLLQIKNLRVGFNNRETEAVRSCSFNIGHGKMTAVVGESGSGKSVTALSVLRLLPAAAAISGEVIYSPDGLHQKQLLDIPVREMERIRGNEIAMIFQEPMTSLNPVFTCGSQVVESLLQHKNITKEQAKAETIELFKQVSLPDPAGMLRRYPHELSGGQKQRVMIAMAMSCQPKLLIADEPTTALDVRVQKNILLLIRELQHERKMSVLLITHDLGLVADMADDIVVMYQGSIVESGPADVVLKNPQHPYTKALLACRPASGVKGKRLPVISDFMNKVGSSINSEITSTERNAIQPLTKVLEVQNLSVLFPSSKNMFGKITAFTTAVDNVSFDVLKNETVGLVGESGCGKTTLGRAILKLVQPDSGRILLNGTDIAALQGNDLRIKRKDFQIIFQDPYGSLNPRISIGDAILEPMQVHRLFGTYKTRRDKAVDLLEKVNLEADMLDRYPHQFSGGQRQRICIARALVLEPSFLIFDESVSALDVSVQAQVLNLITDIKKQMNFTSIFISHDLSVVHYISDRILVMKAGRIIESGTADEVFFNPKDAYTRQLIDAIPGKKLDQSA